MTSNGQLSTQEARYNATLEAHLRRYQSGHAYGAQRQRRCGHWAWDLVVDLPCIGCAATALDQRCYDALPPRGVYNDEANAWRDEANSWRPL